MIVLKQLFYFYIIIGGDGLVKEVVTGLLQRTDIPDVHALPLCIVRSNYLNTNQSHQMAVVSSHNLRILSCTIIYLDSRRHCKLTCA